jgi:hypothetical protein
LDERKADIENLFERLKEREHASAIEG